MTRVSYLIPGDLVSLGGQSAVYVTQAQHPLWPVLQLVVWRLLEPVPEGAPVKLGIWSHDALLAEQDVGEAQRTTSADRQERLRRIFMGRP